MDKFITFLLSCGPLNEFYTPPSLFVQIFIITSYSNLIAVLIEEAHKIVLAENYNYFVFLLF